MIKELTDSTFDASVNENSGTVLVDFSATWCSPCKALEPVIEKVAAEGVVVFKVDIDDCPKLVERFSIRSVPTVAAFKDGKLVNKTVGLVNKDALVKLASV